MIYERFLMISTCMLSIQQSYGGEIVLVPEESLALGKYQVLEG